MHFPGGDQSPDWVFSKCEEASVDEGLVNNTLQGSRLSCDADSVSTYCNQGYKARVLENGHHPHVLLLFEDLTEDDWQAELSDLHEFVVETQNQLEMCLPPAFFDIMPHIMIHMVHQIQVLGPCYLHEMWSYERFMSVLSRYVHNRSYPEGSMIEGYNTEEVVE